MYILNVTHIHNDCYSYMQMKQRAMTLHRRVTSQFKDGALWLRPHGDDVTPEVRWDSAIHFAFYSRPF